MTNKERHDAATAEARTIYDRAKAENRELTAEEIACKDKLFAEISGLRSIMEGEKSLAGLAFSQMHNGMGVKSKAEQQFNALQSAVAGNADEKNRFTGWARGNDRQEFMLTTGTGSGGLVPTQVSPPQIVRRLVNAFVAAKVVTGGSVMSFGNTGSVNIPVADDTSVTGDTPAEDGDSDAAADPSMSIVTLGHTLYSSKSLWASNTLVLANNFDLLGYLMPILERRLELAEDSAWTTTLLSKSAGGNTATTASATAFTYDEVVKAYHALSQPYRSDAVWIVSDAFLQAVRLLKDSENRPLFNMLDPLIGAGAIGSLMGCPLVVGLNMGALTAGQIPAAIVSAECILVRQDERRIAKYTSIPTFPDQCGFRMFENGDCQFNAAGVAFLKMAAS